VGYLRHAAAAGERGIAVHRGDLEDGLPFESETFDVVHANQVIEHVRRRPTDSSTRFAGYSRQAAARAS